MDLSAVGLSGVNTFDDLMAVTGVAPSLSVPVLAALGGPLSLRGLASIRSNGFEDIVLELLQPVPPLGPDGEPGPAFTPVMRSQLRFARRAARLRAGLPVEGTNPIAALGTTPQQANPGVQPTTSKRVKLSSPIDPSAEAELVTLEGAEVRRMFAQTKKATGDFPNRGTEPTEQQLAALAQLLKTGLSP